MYLIYGDFKKNIQSENLQQIISADLSILSSAQLAAEAEAQSYLKQKYDVTKEFKDLPVWSNTNAYDAGDRVYLDASAYSNTSTYAIGDLCLQAGNVYRCKAVTTGAFDAIKWDLVGQQYAIFSAVYPKPNFEYTGFYNVNDLVFWKNYTYKCLVQTPLLSHDTGLQYRAIQNLPLPNVAPDDIQEGANYWGNKTAYSVAAGTLPTNTIYWVNSDNRDQQMVIYLVDLVLYHIHARIAPRNIPDLRVKRYDDAISWLKMCAKGDITPNLPLIQPRQGNRIRFGGNIKQINSY